MQLAAGSSPRLRGTGWRAAALFAVSRFIPAPAGNSRRNGSQPAGRTVHPRACGEQEVPTFPKFPCPGSSPRLRGTDAPTHRIGGIPRFIPAPAGNSLPGCSRIRPDAVHPRACGEQTHRRIGSVEYHGSSPRLRGTDWTDTSIQLHLRFIPAPAGNRASNLVRWCLSTVHPRACGEQPMPLSEKVLTPGSSPRLRGTAAGWFPDPWGRRFIPAPAGNRI